MKAVSSGHAVAEGLSREEAAEFIEDQPTPKSLPEKAKKKEKKAMFMAAFGTEVLQAPDQG